MKTLSGSWTAMYRRALELAELVHPLFVSNGWTWFDDPDNPPSVERIARTIMELADYAYTHVHEGGELPYSVGTGRLRVTVTKEFEGVIEYDLIVELGEL